MVRLATEKSNRKRKISSYMPNKERCKSTPKYDHEEFVIPTYSPVHPLPTCDEEVGDASVGMQDLLNKCSDILSSFPNVPISKKSGAFHEQGKFSQKMISISS